MARKKQGAAAKLAGLVRGQTPRGKAATAKRQGRAFRAGKTVPAKVAEQHAAPPSPFKAAKQAAAKKPRGGNGGR
jgi:hypothetical protein